MGPQLLSEKPCLPCPSNQVHVTPRHQTVHLLPTSGFRSLKPLFAFSCSFASKAGAQTTLTLLPHTRKIPIRSSCTPASSRAPSPRLPQPKQTEVAGSVGLWPPPPLSLLPSPAAISATPHRCRGNSRDERTRWKRPAEHLARGAGLPAMGLLLVMNRRRGGEGASRPWSLGTWHSHALALGAHVHVYTHVTSVCDTCLCV